ncbi:MAG TPA: aromatic ring-hydroxylating dioxygenase subunit alpha, partial [Dehalococcoidia bacterium]|nr:aromatic ring-hydroxylating dioxygenase subunit alpha [Dehalococcoidia bacterium]
EEGQVLVLMNRCRHRANAVCQSEGNSHYFRCSYHGWTYNNKGELVGVPYPSRYGDWFRKEEWGLIRAPRIGSYRGFIFASLSPNGISLDEHLGQPAKEQIDLFCDLSPKGEIDASAGCQKMGYSANWKFQAENTIDGYHPGIVHQSFFEMVQKRTGARIDVFTDTSLGQTRDLGNGHSMLDSRAYNKATGGAGRALRAAQGQSWAQAYLEEMTKRYGKERTQELLTAAGTHTFIWPNLFLLDIQIRVLRPIAAQRTEVHVYPVLLKSVPKQLNAIRLRQHEAFYGPSAFGQPDDIEIFERNRIGLTSQVDPWILLGRGQQLETVDSDGTVVGQVTDEIPQRCLWRHWLKVMSEA